TGVWHPWPGGGMADRGDDFRDSNPPVNGPLLDALCREFVQSQFDLRHLVRLILNSRTYQLSAVPTDSNRDDESNFARAIVRPLQAEQLLDAVAQATDVRPRFPGGAGGLRAGQLPGVVAPRRRGRRGGGMGEGERFLTTFGKPVRSLSCECERSDDTTLAQAFQLITGPLVTRLLAEPD